MNAKQETTGANSDLSEPGFNGQCHESGLGWQLLGNGYRAYSPVLMRFHSPDNQSPFGVGGVNAYGYCRGDPVNRSDSTGHAPMLGFFKGKTFRFTQLLDGDAPGSALFSLSSKQGVGNEWVLMSRQDQQGLLMLESYTRDSAQALNRSMKEMAEQGATNRGLYKYKQDFMVDAQKRLGIYKEAAQALGSTDSPLQITAQARHHLQHHAAVIERRYALAGYMGKPDPSLGQLRHRQVSHGPTRSADLQVDSIRAAPYRKLKVL
ncbi:YD repeat-containing protein [Pseudomonas sp. StFLB209]|nr:RHS repeat-associated core domain-containing protein [Pseudomonas sp. StFLB209]BAP44572.1 YD repeat-containing protein [Pseudomonas sp. StFLB209]